MHITGTITEIIDVLQKLGESASSLTISADFSVSEMTIPPVKTAKGSPKSACLKNKSECGNSKTKQQKIEFPNSTVATEVLGASSQHAQVKNKYQVWNSADSLDKKLFSIEVPSFDKTDDVRSAVFAIKMISDNYFLLFYRNSIFDSGRETEFRKYLSKQPGELVAYRFFHSLSSLKENFQSMGKALRHNGKNELSLLQSQKLLEEFRVFKYL